MIDFDEIASNSLTDEEALMALYRSGATAVQAVKSLINSRGVSHANAKAKLIESPAWQVEAEMSQKLHEQIDSSDDEYSDTSLVTELSDAEILGLKWSDLSCYGCYWEKSLDKPVLIIRIQPPKSQLQELVCDWAANLKMTMECQKNRGGPMLTSEVVFSKQADGRWKVVFECLSDGYIEFDCSSLGFREV